MIWLQKACILLHIFHILIANLQQSITIISIISKILLVVIFPVIIGMTIRNKKENVIGLLYLFISIYIFYHTLKHMCMVCLLITFIQFVKVKSRFYFKVLLLIFPLILTIKFFLRHLSRYRGQTMFKNVEAIVVKAKIKPKMGITKKFPRLVTINQSPQQGFPFGLSGEWA